MNEELREEEEGEIFSRQNALYHIRASPQV
jgi:hypothetical protein